MHEQGCLVEEQMFVRRMEEVMVRKEREEKNESPQPEIVPYLGIC